MANTQILVVEDEKVVAMDIRDTLESLQYRVAGLASSGQEAIQKTAEKRPDLVLMDIRLQGEMSGTEAAKQIRSRFDVPVVYLTAHADGQTIEQAKVTEPYGYIIKPFDARELHIAVEVALYKHQMDRKLKESEQRFATTLKSIGDAVIATNRQGCVTFMNPAAENLTGWKQEEALGTDLAKVFDIINEETRRPIESPIAKALREEATVSLANGSILIGHHGTETPIDDSAAPIKDENGNMTGAVLVFRDISTSKRAKEALRKSEVRYRRIIEAVTDYVYTVHVEGGRPVKTIHGPGCVSVTGYSSEDFAADPNLWVRMVEEGDQPLVVEQAGRVLAGQEAQPIEHRIVRKDQVRRWVRHTLVLHLDVEGKLLSYDGLVQDITEYKQATADRRHLEAQLFQAQKMESIGTFAGGVAHDFNNLLTAIIGNAQLAQSELRPHDPVQTRLTEIENASNRAASLTTQLLAFSRRQRLEPNTIDLNDTVGHFMKMLRRIIGEDVEIHLQPAANLSAVFADPAQIEQVVMNLAVNARDAMPGGGRLIIETQNVELQEAYCREYPWARPGQYVQLTISDTGCGMDAKTQRCIFDPFFTTKEVGKGTGLGLSVVYGIVKQHDGLIQVYSQVGHGTSFKIYLPATEKHFEATTRQIEPVLRGGAETVLVAEDEEAISKLARAALTRLGYTVLLARNGVEAVEIFVANRKQIGLVVSDLVMPRMGGEEVCKRIREMGSDVPVLFMTGYSADMARSQFGAEASGLLIKPYSVDALGRKVRELLDRRLADCRISNAASTGE